MAHKHGVAGLGLHSEFCILNYNIIHYSVFK